jgi:hypothetical protein
MRSPSKTSRQGSFRFETKDSVTASQNSGTEELEQLLNDGRNIGIRAQSIPHPKKTMAQQGYTLWDYACYALHHGTDAHRETACRLLKKV